MIRLLRLLPLALLLSLPARAQEEAPQRLDLNAATAEDLMMLKGIGRKTADTILEHRDARGGFTRLDQVTDIRGIGEKTLQRLACVFMVPAEGPLPCVPEEGRKATPAAGGKVNVNLAGPGELTGLKGIGPKKAAAIVAYRAESGWFTSAEDLDGVKGIGPKTVAGFAAQVEVLVDVNRATVEDLRRLGFANAEAIVSAREAVGGFASTEDLEAVPGTDAKTLRRARHILIFPRGE
ncbi:MAG: ComEA family DNA-binding protein [Deltaproteobacteria bacterium]|nr:ComEA family DNA-binding protein [Deltaproteobacteria bacterium]